MREQIYDWFDHLVYVVDRWRGRLAGALRRRARLLRYRRALHQSGVTITTRDPLGLPGSYATVGAELVVVGPSSGAGPYTTRVAPVRSRWGVPRG